MCLHASKANLEGIVIIVSTLRVLSMLRLGNFLTNDLTCKISATASYASV